MMLMKLQSQRMTTPEITRRKKRGFSMSETMVALMIVSLVSLSIATGVAFAVRQHNRVVAYSEARILCSSLTSIFQEELGNTRTYINGSDGNPKTLRFFSTHYTPKLADSNENRNLSDVISVIYAADGTTSTPADGYGQVVLRTYNVSKEAILTPVLQKESYVPQHGLAAKAEVKYDCEEPTNPKDYGVFTVTIRIRSSAFGAKDLLESTFYVIPLNKPVDASKSAESGS